MRIVPAPAVRRGVAGLALLALVAGCGAGAQAEQGGPLVVVSTSVLGEVVSSLVGDAARVEVVMGPGADPHEFAPSARQVATMRDADALIVNGAGFEEALLPTVDAARDAGVPVHEAITSVRTLTWEGHAHDDNEHEAGAHDDGDVDPHFFTDPSRMAEAVEGIAAFLRRQLAATEADSLRSSVATYLTDLERADREVEDLLAEVPEPKRVLVTNHDVLGYFADRYGFEVLGSILPAGTTLAEASPADLAELAGAIEEAEVPAVFVDAAAGERLAEALADEVGHDVEVIGLHTESLGAEGSGAETYLDMVLTNARLVHDALTR